MDPLDYTLVGHKAFHFPMYNQSWTNQSGILDEHNKNQEDYKKLYPHFLYPQTRFNWDSQPAGQHLLCDNLDTWFVAHATSMATRVSLPASQHMKQPTTSTSSLCMKHLIWLKSQVFPVIQDRAARWSLPKTTIRMVNTQKSSTTTTGHGSSLWETTLKLQMELTSGSGLSNNQITD